MLIKWVWAVQQLWQHPTYSPRLRLCSEVLEVSQLSLASLASSGLDLLPGLAG